MLLGRRSHSIPLPGQLHAVVYEPANAPPRPVFKIDELFEKVSATATQLLSEKLNPGKTAASGTGDPFEQDDRLI